MLLAMKPGWHSVQEVDAAEELYRPAVHTLHELEPWPPVNVPASHAVHLVEAGLAAK